MTGGVLMRSNRRIAGLTMSVGAPINQATCLASSGPDS